MLDQPYLLYSTHNISLVKSAASGPSSPAQFTVSGPSYIAWIGTYHYYADYVSGTISLEDSNGTVYGPWATKADVNRYHWSVSPDVEIPAGTYTVVDSHPESWSFNNPSGNAGMLEVAGYTVISGATERTYTLQPADGGYSILFEVTPEDANGNRGPAALSAAFGPVMMAASGSGGGSGDTGGTAAAEATPEGAGEPGGTPQAAPTKAEFPDSGARFSALSGQVAVWIPIGYDDGGAPVYDEKAWDFARLDSELPVQTRIETSPGSSAILSLGDMATFVMKPESKVVLSKPQAKSGQLQLLAGNLWASLPTMTKGGLMDIEMPQAVATIKGATFVLEGDGETSALKVIEGTVEFTSKATGESAMVEGGKTVSATANGLGKPRAFDAEAAIADWAQYGAKMPSGGFPLWAILAIAGGALAVVLAVVIAVASSRKKRKTAGATYPAYAQGAYPPPAQSARSAPQNAFCAQCGAELAPGGKFCVKCGAPRQAPLPEPPPWPPAGAGGPPAFSKPPAPPRRKTAVLIGVIAAVLALTLLGIFVIGPNISRWLDGGAQTALGPGKTTDSTVATFKDPETVVYSERFGYFPVNQMAVVFYDDVSSRQAAKILKQIGGTVVGELEIINLYQIETDFTTEAELDAAMEAARALDGVELVFPNAEIVADITVEGTPCSPLNDPAFEDPANAREYQIIGLDNAWRIIKASGIDPGKVKMGALDTALYTGADDAGEFMGNSRVTGPTTDQPATNSRGQIIAGGLSHGRRVSNVMSGIVDLLEDNVEIDVTNLFDGQPEFTETQEDEEDITQGIYGGTAYAIKGLVYLKQQVDNNATVINCSFNPKVLSDNGEWISKAYTKFFEYMQKKKPGVVFVCSAGNAASADKSSGGSNGKNNWPGGLPLPNVITVGALNDDGSRADFSNFEAEGGEVTLSAPGVDMVVGIDKDGKPVKSNGTSFAAPQVAGAVALLQAINPELNAQQIKELLIKTAAPGVPADVKPGEVKPGDQSVLIPEGMGAGVLRVDEAVLQAINDLNSTSYTLEQMVEMGTVRLTATGGPKEYTITASITKARTGSADVKIEVTGTHSMTGSTTQNVSEGGSATWSLTLDKDPVFVRVVRLDCHTCAYLTLEPAKVPTLAEMAGLYADGTYTFSKVFISDALVAEAQSAASESDEEGCDMDILNQLRAYEGKTAPLAFTIFAYGETEGGLQGQGDSIVPFSYSPDSGAMTFAMSDDKQRMAGTLYAVISEETTVVISGTLRLTYTEISEDDFYILMTITGTKPLSTGP